MKPTRITVHYSATRPEWMEGRSLLDKIAEIRRWHVARGWKREGYHWFIDRDGAEAPGRPFTMQGAHVGGHNSNNIGICVLGGHGGQADGQFDDNFTEAQEAALIRRIKTIQREFDIPDSWVRGHNNYAATSCPGCDIPTWWKSARLGIMATASTQRPQGPSRTPTPRAPQDGSQRTPQRVSGGFWAALQALFVQLFGGKPK